MVNAARTRQLPLSALFLLAFATTGFLLLWRTSSPLSAFVGIDLDFLFPPLALWALFMLLSLLAEFAAGTRFAAMTWRPTRSSAGLRLAEALSSCKKLMIDLAWFALALATLSMVPTLVGAVEARADGPDLSWLRPYVEVLHSMSQWGILLMLPVAVVRTLADAWPELGGLLPSPWSRIAALGVGFVLLAGGGVLDVAFDFDGTAHLLALTGALGLSYLAQVARNALRAERSPRRLPALRGALLLGEAAWIVIALGVVAGLPSAVEQVMTGHFGQDAATADAYLAGLHGLISPQAFLVMLPLAIVRVGGVFWPNVERILGFPVGLLAVLGVVYALCSENGILPAALAVSTSQLMTVLAAALALSYAASALHKAAAFELPGRMGASASVALSLASAAVSALAAGMTVWVLLNHLPVANAALVDYESTRTFGRDALPYFNVFFDARATVAALTVAVAFVLSLPWARHDRTAAGHRPMLNAVCYGATGCLVWAAGSTLSPLGHGFVLAGAGGAGGFFALAIAQAVGHLVTPRSATLGSIARWLTASRVRTFVLGAAAAAYVLLLRPVVYEALWFAPLYEYIALLALLVLALIFVLDLLGRDSESPASHEPEWNEWSHHRQTLESKEDPRSSLTAEMRREFVEYGEWKPLFTYLMGLLYRNGASRTWMQAVCRPLRLSAVSSPALPFLRRSNLGRLGRLSALNEASRRVDEALAMPEATMQPVTEDELRSAAEQFVDTGIGVERVAIALIVAQSQRGGDLQGAIDRWFPLMDAPDSSASRTWLPWARSDARLRDRRGRAGLLSSASAEVLGRAAFSGDGPNPKRLVDLVGAATSRDAGA